MKCPSCHMKCKKSEFVGEVCCNCHEFKLFKPRLKKFLKWYRRLSSRKTEEFELLLQTLIDTPRDKWHDEIKWGSFEDVLKLYNSHVGDVIDIDTKDKFIIRITFDDDNGEYQIKEKGCDISKVRMLLALLNIQKHITKLKPLMKISKIIFL